MFTFFRNEEQIKEYYEKKTNKKIVKENCKTDYKKAVMENKKNLLPEVQAIRELKRSLKEPKTRRFISNILLFLAVIMTCITTLVTISGGIGYRETILTMVTFILFVSFAQLTILIISCLKPYLAKKATKYLNISLFAQTCLLLVSISFNFMFMYNHNNSLLVKVLNVVLCIIFDLVIILMCEISFTIRLNIVFSKDDNISIFSRISNIFSNIINYRLARIENNVNKKGLMFVYDKQTENKKPVQFENKEIKQIDSSLVYDKQTEENTVNKTLLGNKNSLTFVSDKDVGVLKDTILNYRDGNISPSTSALMELTGFSKEKVIESKKTLEKKGLIKTKDRKTYIQNIDILENVK